MCQPFQDGKFYGCYTYNIGVNSYFVYNKINAQGAYKVPEHIDIRVF